MLALHSSRKLCCLSTGQCSMSSILVSCTSGHSNVLTSDLGNTIIHKKKLVPDYGSKSHRLTSVGFDKNRSFFFIRSFSKTAVDIEAQIKSEIPNFKTHKVFDYESDTSKIYIVFPDPPVSNDPKRPYIAELLDSKNHLMPETALVEEYEVVFTRYKKAKISGKKPNPADCLWLMLISVKLGNVARAFLFMEDMKLSRELDIKYYELLAGRFAYIGRSDRVLEIFEIIKRGVERRTIGIPSQAFFDVTFEAHYKNANIYAAMKDYDLQFSYNYIPTNEHIKILLRCASAAADLNYFNFFYNRVIHKNIKLSKSELVEIMEIYGTKRYLLTESRKKNVSSNDFCVIIEVAMRIHNMKMAHDLLLECRDSYKILPDARLYETFLNGCIRDNHLRAKARKWKEIFKKYPKKVENREDHYAFAVFLKELEVHLGETMCNAPIEYSGETFKLTRTTRKQSRQLYNHFPKILYHGLKFEDPKLFEWVPSYLERRRLAGYIHEQSLLGEELKRIKEIAEEEAKLPEKLSSPDKELEEYIRRLVDSRIQRRETGEPILDVNDISNNSENTIFENYPSRNSDRS